MQKGGQTAERTPYLPSNSSVVVFQSLIELPSGFTIRKTVMRDFLEPSLFEIIADFAAVDAVFRRMHSEDFAEEFERPLAVPFKIRQNFAHVEMPLAREAARVEQQIARNRHPHNRAADVDVWKIERFS